MSKRVFIAEKPSVAREFASALGLDFTSRDGYMDAGDTIVTWCVGHLVTMCYPDAYDPKYKKWSLATIPFIPDTYKYQVIDGVKKQFEIVKRILTDQDVKWWRGSKVGRCDAQGSQIRHPGKTTPEQPSEA